MKKVLLSAIALIAFATSNAQSHQAGNFTIDVLGGYGFGSGNSKTDEVNAEKYKFSAVGANFSVQAQYGFSENFSAGLDLGFGSTVATPKNTNSLYIDEFGDLQYDYSASQDITLNMFNVGLSGRYYFLNKEKINVYGSVGAGYTSAKDNTSYPSVYGYDYYYYGVDSNNTKYSGLNASIKGGMHYFFTDHFGVTAQVGYTNYSLTNKETVAGETIKTKANIGLVGINAGLAFKF